MRTRDPVALASHRAHGVRLIRSAVDLRCGCHDQAVVRQTTGSGGGIQSAQAWKTIACLPQLSSLGAPTDAGSGCASGQESHANQTLPGLVKLLDSLPESKRPMLVRGDAGLAGEPLLYALEGRGQNYLFKLRLTSNVKRYIEKLFWETDWKRAGQGWEGKGGELRLEGWSCSRRVVVLRR